MLTPWLAGALPVLAPALATERTEIAFLTASLGISGATLLSARWGAHVRWAPIGMFSVAAAALVTVRAIGAVETPPGQVVIVCAACLMTAAHWANIRCCRATAHGGRPPESVGSCECRHGVASVDGPSSSLRPETVSSSR